MPPVPLCWVSWSSTLPVPGWSCGMRVLCQHPSYLPTHLEHKAYASIPPWAAIARNPHARTAWWSLKTNPLPPAMPSTGEAQCLWDLYRLEAVAPQLAGSPCTCPPHPKCPMLTPSAIRRICVWVNSSAGAAMAFQSPPELTHRTQLCQR